VKDSILLFIKTNCTNLVELLLYYPELRSRVVNFIKEVYNEITPTTSISYFKEKKLEVKIRLFLSQYLSEESVQKITSEIIGLKNILILPFFYYSSSFEINIKKKFDRDKSFFTNIINILNYIIEELEVAINDLAYENKKIIKNTKETNKENSKINLNEYRLSSIVKIVKDLSKKEEPAMLSTLENIFSRFVDDPNNKIWGANLISIAANGTNINLLKLLLKYDFKIKVNPYDNSILKILMSKGFSEQNFEMMSLVIPKLTELPDIKPLEIKMLQYILWSNHFMRESEVEKFIMNFIHYRKVINFNYFDDKGNSLLHYALQNHNTSRNIIKLLLNNFTGDDVHKGNIYSMSPFIMAVFKGNIIAIEELYKKGFLTAEYAKNIPNAILHFAITSGNDEVVEFLINKVCNNKQINFMLLQQTPFEFANNIGRHEIAKLIQGKMINNLAKNHLANIEMSHDTTIISPLELKNNNNNDKFIC